MQYKKANDYFSYPPYITACYRISIMRWIAISALIILILLYLPWQQAIYGQGYISSLHQGDRIQYIESKIEGNLEQWHIKEGQYVKEGQLLLTLKDLDSNYLSDNIVQYLGNMSGQLIGSQNAYLAKAQQLNQARQNLIQNLNKNLEEVQNNVSIGKIDHDTAVLNYNRSKQLAKEGLISTRELELAQQQIINTEKKYQIRQIELEQTRSKNQADIHKIEADYQETIANMQKNNSEISKIKISQDNIQIRKSYAQIYAPCDGQITRVYKYGKGETIKKQDRLIALIPQNISTQDNNTQNNKIIELFINAYDAPLIKVGQKVAIQFYGMPSIQVVNLPFHFPGTFDGIVQSIDHGILSTNQQYRVLIAPDLDSKYGNWHNISMLRLGSPASAWIKLSNVSLGYELWRRFNGLNISMLQDPETARQTKEELKL